MKRWAWDDASAHPVSHLISERPIVFMKGEPSSLWPHPPVKGSGGYYSPLLSLKRCIKPFQVLPSIFFMSESVWHPRCSKCHVGWNVILILFRGNYEFICNLSPYLSHPPSGQSGWNFVHNCKFLQENINLDFFMWCTCRTQNISLF